MRILEGEHNVGRLVGEENWNNYLMSKILIVESEEQRIGNEIQEISSDVISVRSLEACKTAIDDKIISVVIIDFDFCGFLGKKEIYDILNKNATAPDLIVAAAAKKSLGELVRYPALKILEKPIKISDIIRVSPSFNEAIRNLVAPQVSDYLQMLSFGNYSVRLEVETDDDCNGHVCLKKGRITQASISGMNGLDGLKKVVHSTARKISVMPNTSRAETRSDEFEESVSSLLLRIMVEKDELNRTSENGRLNENHTDSISARAMVAYFANEYMEAEELYDSCQKLEPANLIYRFNRSLIRQLRLCSLGDDSANPSI